MSLALILFFFQCVILNTVFVQSATNTYTLGANSATVTTAAHLCCSGQTTDVTVSVDAILNQKSNVRTTFGSSFDRRMTELGKLPGDEKGHILASVFGGPAVTWNLAPQANNVNRRLTDKNSLLTGWYECEKYIQGVLESGQGLPVRARMTLTYAAQNCRPTHWSISATSNTRGDPGCQALNIINGYGGPFAACSTKNG